MAGLPSQQIVNCFSVDVEDYFHPSEVQRSVGPESWASMPSRVEQATCRLLEQMDGQGVRGTYFILGWVAEHHPGLVRSIAGAGHEIGCHSHLHQLVYNLSPEAFRHDTLCAVRAIEDACGVQPRVYRAPSYSVTSRSMWALEILAECGFTHDSSIYPIEHDRYGIPGFSRFAQTIHTPSGPITEVPVATVVLPGGRVAPVGGGGYLRLLPYRYTAAGLRRINHQEGRPACLYVHPWEVDEGQPRLASGWISRARTYGGLRQMPGKIKALMREFAFSTLTSVFPARP